MIPSVREVRWSFAIVALCGVALTATICWGVVHKINQSDDIVRIAASSADQVERLSAQLDAQAKTAAEQRAELERQKQLTRAQYQLTRAQLRAVLAYLRSHGIAVPPEVLPPPPSHAGPSPKGPAASSGTPLKPPASPAPATPPSPTASPAPRPSVLCALLPLICP